MKETKDQNQMAEERTQMSHERTDMAFERTKLANSQTALSYLRTTITVFAAGIGMFEFVDSYAIIKMGIILMIISPVILIIGVIHFFRVSKRLNSLKKNI